MRSRPRWKAGRRTACPRIRVRGSSLRVGSRRSIDCGERSIRASQSHTCWSALPQTNAPEVEEGVEDDRLRLIFTCCHPALSPDAQIALTLREVCGLTTEEVARSFLTPAPTLAQRIVRAKAKIRDAGIPYEIPSLPDLPARLDSVLHVIYLVFNEGYLALSGDFSHEGRPVGRSNSSRPTVGRATARARGDWIACSDAAPRSTTTGASIACGRADTPRGAGSIALESRANRRRSLAGREGAGRSRRIGPYSLQAAIRGGTC